MRETALYLPIKTFLEVQGYEVKAEVKACDVVALRGDEPPLIVELKTSLTLQLFYQALDRLTLTDTVYVAIPRPKRGLPRDAVKLAKRIGLGLLMVAPSGSVDVLAQCQPYMPRKNAAKARALLKEFTQRRGDPNTGGSTKTKLITAYRQDALRCLAVLHHSGPMRVADLRQHTKVARAGAILRDNHYGWFSKQARGIYRVEAEGAAAMAHFAAEIAALTAAGPKPA